MFGCLLLLYNGAHVAISLLAVTLRCSWPTMAFLMAYEPRVDMALTIQRWTLDPRTRLPE